MVLFFFFDYCYISCKTKKQVKVSILLIISTADNMYCNYMSMFVFFFSLNNAGRLLKSVKVYCYNWSPPDHEGNTHTHKKEREKGKQMNANPEE